MTKKIENTDEENEEIKKKKRQESQNKQLKIILIGMFALFLVALGVYGITKSSSNFVYGGLTFKKLSTGDLEFYISEITKEESRVSITGQAVSEVGYYQLTFRNDPRTWLL